MKVVFFHRKKLQGAYSIEALFENVRKALPSDVTYSVKELSFISQGFFKRLYILLESALHQGDINHITGDVHFITLLLRKKRTILTIHDIGFMSHPRAFERFLLKWFWLILPVRRSAAVTVVSKATKEALRKYFKGDSRLKIHVIPNPIGDEFVRMESKFNDKEPVILQIGTKPNKNLSRLIEAISGIKCKLDVVGQLTEEILTKLKIYNIDFVISKNLTREEIVNKYMQADIVSLVSTYEGFGLPIVEANAVGRVVVTSNVSSMPEVAGKAAHLVDPFDIESIRSGFMKVINDATYREQLISNGFENRKRFDNDRIASQYAAVYESIMRNEP